MLAQPQLAVRFMTVKSNRELNRAVLVGGLFILAIPGVAYVVGALTNVYFFREMGQISAALAGGNVDKVIPLYISTALPRWFSYIFMLSLLSAAMSTISSQFHTIGSAFARDLCELVIGRGHKRRQYSTWLTRLGIGVALVMALFLAYRLPGGIIAIATALFFALCAATFLPAFTAALFWRRATKPGVIAGMVTGFTTSVLMLLFTHQKEAAALGLCRLLFGRDVLFGMPWPFVDPLLIAMPVGLLVMVTVSLPTRPYAQSHLERCFRAYRSVITGPGASEKVS